MVMRYIGSFHYPRLGLFPEAQPGEINMGKGEWILLVCRNNHTQTDLLYRYNTFMSVHLHLLSFFMTK